MSEPIIEVRHLSKSFGTHVVLRDVDFTVKPGDVTCVIGASGSGKSTLLRCINLLETPTAGSILFHGQDIMAKGFDPCGYRARVGMVFQSFNLFPQYTALENVMLASLLLAKGRPDYKQNKRAIHEEIEGHAMELLSQMSLEGRMSHYPHQLSGGQQQRVAIARALALHPDILCFDEPTSALDPELTGEVLKVIKGLKSGDSTMIVVTHEMEFARNVADKVIFMSDGVIEETGTPYQIFENPQSEKTKAFLLKSLEQTALEEERR